MVTEGRQPAQGDRDTIPCFSHCYCNYGEESMAEESTNAILFYPCYTCEADNGITCFTWGKPRFRDGNRLPKCHSKPEYCSETRSLLLEARALA
jgi:hypothetical protein